jgi:hypothetical protein
MRILYFIAAIVQLVCWIMVLVQIFKHQQIALGIVGIICGIVAFVYGWMKSGEWGIRNIMLVWTLAFVAQIATGAMLGPEIWGIQPQP